MIARWIWMVMLAAWPSICGAATITCTEVYPKPVRGGEMAHFRVTLYRGEGLFPSPGDFEITINKFSLRAKYEGRIEKSTEEADYFFSGKAPVDFDWRQVVIRLGGQDYPAGPDDPYMICDAPFRTKSTAANLPISVAFHDADNDDVQLQFMEIFNDASGELVTSYPIWEWISVPFHSYLFNDLNAGNFNCSEGDTAWVKVVLHCDDHDFPWIPEEYTFTQHLKVRIGRELPSLPGWFYGDVHTHSRYTNNLYEYGGPLEMFAAAAEAIGLLFVTISDHSSDFDASGNLWQQMADDCAAYSTDAVHLFPAEEVCLDDNEVNNTIDNRIHFLNYSNAFIRGPEAPITFCMDTSDDFTKLSQALAQMEALGGFGYAAHPFQDYDPFLALFGLAMMNWSDENYDLGRASSAFSGLKLWNERNRYRKNVSYWYELNPFPWENNPNWALENTWITGGIAQWDEFLSAGLAQNLIVPAILPQKLFISAGSDCHGDFNYRTYNVDPIFYDVYATDNAFGCLRTAVFVPGYQPGELPPLDEIMTAYRLGRSIATDGPFLEIGIDANGDGDLSDSKDLRIGDDGVIFTSDTDSASVIVRWESSEDWGQVQSVFIYRGNATTGMNPALVLSSNPNNYSGEQSLPLTDLVPSPSEGWVYLRGEAQGSLLPDDARRAFTNPVWLRIDTTPTASVTLDPEQLPIILPPNGGDFDYAITITNHQSTPVNCTLWMDAVLPNGTVYPLLNAPISLSAGQSVSRLRTQTVPGAAPAGDYAYRSHIGPYPIAWFSDGIAFSKTGGGDASNPLSGWQEDGNADFADLEPSGWVDSAGQSKLTVNLHPNPFNLEVEFTLDLLQESEINLSIYDLSGRRVTTLAQGRQKAGEHAIRWAPGDIASGIYLYRINIGGAEVGGKLILLK